MSLGTRFILAFSLLVSTRLFGSLLLKRSARTCEELRCITSNGINVLFAANSGNVDTAYIHAIDSMWINLTVNQCSAGFDTLKLNGMPVDYVVHYGGYSGNVLIRLLSRPGTYEVTGNVIGLQETIAFTLIMDPVGIKEIPKPDDRISVFPNPATTALHIVSKTEGLCSVSIRDIIGKEIQHVDLPQRDLIIPLEQYPPGTYFIQAATLSNRIVVKKFIISR